MLILERTKVCISVCQPVEILGASLASHRLSGFVWSGNDCFVRGDVQTHFLHGETS
jgi:hypothetical protein